MDGTWILTDVNTSTTELAEFFRSVNIGSCVKDKLSIMICNDLEHTDGGNDGGLRGFRLLGEVERKN